MFQHDIEIAQGAELAAQAASDIVEGLSTSGGDDGF